MKKYFIISIIALILVVLVMKVVPVFAEAQQQDGYVWEHEKDLATEQVGPHGGGGSSTAYNFFAKASNVKMAFRKRILHPGSAIGYHLQETDEIYYIVNGTGEMQMNGKIFTVKAGDAVLTRPGSSHGLKPVGNKDLTIIITYQQ